MLKYFIIIIAVGFLYESVSWLYRLFVAYSWIKKERLNYQTPSLGLQKIYILLPVLAEADILENTAEYFNTHFMAGRDDTFLVIITTEKENINAEPTRNTIHIARDLAQQNAKIIHINFPAKNGKMAHQLNYAIHELTNRVNGIRDGDILAVYNADSRPEKETLDWVRVKFKKGGIQVFQQHGCYTGNILSMVKLPWKSVLISASMWQTRWAIGFEIFNALKQLKFTGKKDALRLNYPFNYCIGHGLFITPQVFKTVGGFSEDMHNEDAILGLQLSNMQEIIMPIPYFDISESPNSLIMLYKQKSNWYFGPLQSYAYFAYILKKSSFSFYRKFRLFILSSKLFTHAIFWIMGPSLVVLGLVIGIVEHDSMFLLIVVASITLFGVPSLVSYIFMLHLKTTPDSMGAEKAMKSLIMGFFICYMLHGASAYRGIVKYIKQLISGQITIKEKTVINRTG